MVAVDAAKFAAQTGFQRINPKTDLFKVRDLARQRALHWKECSRMVHMKPRWHVILMLSLLHRQVVRFHHIDWWCADALSTQKRYWSDLPAALKKILLIKL